MRGLCPPMQRKYTALRLVHADSGRQREECEFLPAALEILETPPSPAGRTLVLTLVSGLVTVSIMCRRHLRLTSAAKNIASTVFPEPPVWACLACRKCEAP